MEPCPTARHTTPRIRLDGGGATGIRDRDDAQQSRSAIPPSAPDAGPYRTLFGRVGLESSPIDPIQSNACGLRRAHPTVPPGWPGTAMPPLVSGAVSGRMSMRHPVSLAARRAFCPSLPMASESW